jgi:hypothetical protein
LDQLTHLTLPSVHYYLPLLRYGMTAGFGNMK